MFCGEVRRPGLALYRWPSLPAVSVVESHSSSCSKSTWIAPPAVARVS